MRGTKVFAKRAPQFAFAHAAWSMRWMRQTITDARDHDRRSPWSNSTTLCITRWFVL